MEICREMEEEKVHEILNDRAKCNIVESLFAVWIEARTSARS